MNTIEQVRRSAVAVFCGGVLFAAAAQAQVAPPLGQAEGFAVLGASAVSNTGATVINGDVGIWPNTASSVTGFPPGVVVGTLHAGDAVAQQAQSDLTTAYDVVAGQACDTDLTGQDLGGLTLTPGVYCFSDSAQITGTLSLDALGDDAAVFIFQIGSTLTLASSAQVERINGGSDCNVFWQVGSSATLGTASSLAGNILALTSITLTTGANVSGRALARNGAVTLDTNGVAVCTGCPPIEIAPSTLPDGVLGETYSQNLSASGGAQPYSFDLGAGALPPGLLLGTTGPANASVSGIPSATGSYTFTINATDANSCSGERIYTVDIDGTACPSITLSPSTLGPVVTAQPYQRSFTAAGGSAPYSIALSDGALPEGLQLTASGPASALLSGTPLGAGTYAFVLTATDADGCTVSGSYAGTITGVASRHTIPASSSWSLGLLLLLLALVGLFALRR